MSTRFGNRFLILGLLDRLRHDGRRRHAPGARRRQRRPAPRRVRRLLRPRARADRRRREAEPERPIVVLSQGSPNGFLRRAFQAGADDILPLPQTPDQIRFAVQKAARPRAGRQSPTASIATRPARLRARPQGRDRQDAHGGEPRGRPRRGAASGSRSSTSTSSSGTSRSASGFPPEQTIYDLAQSRRLARLRQARVVPRRRTPPASARCSRPRRPDQASAVSTELLREVYALLRTHVDYVIVDTPPGFTAEVIATIDNSTDVVMVGMLDSLSLKNTKLGLETLELMGYDRTTSSWCSTAPTAASASASPRSIAVLGREPDVFVPSDREIPAPSTKASRSSSAQAAVRAGAGVPPARRDVRRHHGRRPPGRRTAQRHAARAGCSEGKA